VANPRENLRRELGGGGPPQPAEKPAPKVERVMAERPKMVTQRHHDTCPGLRGRECACASNLQWLVDEKVKPLERRKVSWEETVKVDGVPKVVERSIELWRLDDGKDWHTTVTGTSALKRPIPRTIKLPPRWVCTGCGWAGRGSDVSHRCDKAAVALAARAQSVAAALTAEQRFSGGYRLVIWQDSDLIYHLAEELVDDNKVKALVEIDSDGNYNVIEGALLSAVVDRFTP
jgi:hypothetical protein